MTGATNPLPTRVQRINKPFDGIERKDDVVFRNDNYVAFRQLQTAIHSTCESQICFALNEMQSFVSVGDGLDRFTLWAGVVYQNYFGNRDGLIPNRSQRLLQKIWTVVAQHNNRNRRN